MLLECGNQRAKVGGETILDLVLRELGPFLEKTLCKDHHCGLVPFVRRGAG